LAGLSLIETWKIFYQNGASVIILEVGNLGNGIKYFIIHVV